MSELDGQWEDRSWRRRSTACALKRSCGTLASSCHWRRTAGQEECVDSRRRLLRAKESRIGAAGQGLELEGLEGRVASTANVCEAFRRRTRWYHRTVIGDTVSGIALCIVFAFRERFSRGFREGLDHIAEVWLGRIVLKDVDLPI